MALPATQVPTGVELKRHAERLSQALEKASKVDGLNQQALSAAAALMLSLGESNGRSMPQDYLTKRVELVTLSLKSVETVRREHDTHDERSSLARALARFTAQSPERAASIRAALESALEAYCVARGSGSQWRRASA